MDLHLRLPRDEFEFLAALVETARKRPLGPSESFTIVPQSSTTMLVLTRLPPDAQTSRRVLGELVRKKLLKYEVKEGSEHFTITADGFAYYDRVMR